MFGNPCLSCNKIFRLLNLLTFLVLISSALSKYSRFCGMGVFFAIMFSTTSEDIIYCTLPLYHSIGGGFGVASCFFVGNTVVLRRKFSASRFWEECVEHKATVCKK